MPGKQRDLAGNRMQCVGLFRIKIQIVKIFLLSTFKSRFQLLNYGDFTFKYPVKLCDEQLYDAVAEHASDEETIESVHSVRSMTERNKSRLITVK